MARPLSPARAPLVTVALCYIVALFEGFDLQAAGVAAPALKSTFGMSPTALGWFFSASTFGLMIGAAAGGRLSDRVGRRTVLIASVAMFGAMSLFTAAASSANVLLLARFLTGAGIGGALPNLVALAAENAPAARRNASVGLLYAGLPSGGALAALTAIFVAPGDWRGVFLVGGLAPVVAIPLLIAFLPESRQLAAAIERPGGVRTGLLAASFGSGRAPRSALLWIGFFLSLLTLYLILNWLPTLMIGRGLSRDDASLVQVAFNLFGAPASLITGLLMDRVSLPRLIGGVFVSAAASLALLAVAPAQWAASIAVGALVGITMSATQAVLYAIAPANYPTEVRGTGVGLAVSIGRIGSASGPLLAGWLLGTGRMPQQVLAVLAPIIVAAGIAVLILSLLMRRSDQAASA